ncbi:MAG TPA: DciA family protein [Tepidisphaeraceae bacterium]
MRQRPPDLDLSRLHRVKQRPAPPTDPLGPELLDFFKTSIQKRHTKLSAIADCWTRLVPEHLAEHSALEGFYAGTLKVIVDSSPHLYDLKQLLLAGLQQQLILACKSSGLRKVTLKLGRWYDGSGPDRKIRF